MLVVFLYVNVVEGIWQSTRLDCTAIDMLFNLLVFASFAKLQHNTESRMRGAVRGCGYLGDAKKMYQNVASHLEQTSKYKYKWQCVHECILLMCVSVWVPCSLKPAFVSFSFGLKPPLGRPWPLICNLLWAYPSSLLLLGGTHIISGNVCWHFACKSPQIGISALDSSPHLRQTFYITLSLFRSLHEYAEFCAFHLGKRKCNLLWPKCDVILDSKNCDSHAENNIHSFGIQICAILWI